MNLSSISAVEQIGQAQVDAIKNEAGGNLARIEEVAEQFESVFTSMILKQMRRTLDKGLFGEEGSDSYGAMFDMYMGQHLAERGGMGIREAIVEQYTRNQNL